jgi:hypothetical protein
MEITVPAATSVRYTGQIVDRTVTPAAGFKPETLKWTLWDVDKQAAGLAAIVNARKDIDALADCDSAGNFHIDLTTTDMALVDSTKNSETHILLVFWTYNSGTDYGECAVRIGLTRTIVPAT